MITESGWFRAPTREGAEQRADFKIHSLIGPLTSVPVLHRGSTYHHTVCPAHHINTPIILSSMLQHPERQHSHVARCRAHPLVPPKCSLSHCRHHLQPLHAPHHHCHQQGTLTHAIPSTLPHNACHRRGMMPWSMQEDPCRGDAAAILSLCTAGACHGAHLLL